MIDALERWLTKSFEKELSRRHNKPLQFLRLLPEPSLPSVNLSISLYLRNTFVFFVALVLLGFFVLAVYFVYLVLNMFTLHQIQQHHQAMLHIAIVAVKSEVFALCFAPLGGAFLTAAGLAPSFWAWNRRADRLNREGITPPAAAEVTGVWPPPPNVSR